MDKLQISQCAKNKVAQSILITGAARSGTTILGKIVHSFNKVEFEFEPPMMFSLLPLLGGMSESKWKLLFETYLYESHFINAVCGRNLNFNEMDDSSILKVKSKEEIENRLKVSVRKSDAESIFKDHLIAFKMPDAIPYLGKLSSYYPEMKMVVIRRDPVSTINSLVAKGWFADGAADHNFIWPFYVDDNGVRIPYWVGDQDFDQWIEMNEADRCAYYYLRMRDGLDRLSNCY